MAGLDRNRGVLTKDDRQYLLGRKNLNRDSERNARLRIRNRARNALYDFEYLATELASKDRTQLAVDDGIADEELFTAAEDAIAFLFSLCQHAPNSESYSPDDRFRDILKNGIEKGLTGEQTVLDFSLDLQYGLPREAQARIQRKLRQGESLTFAELREALNNDYLNDTYLFRPLDTADGLPKNVEGKDLLSHEDY
jgi:hypothetical protein